MKRKIFKLVLIVILILASLMILTACGDSEEGSGSNSSAESVIKGALKCIQRQDYDTLVEKYVDLKGRVAAEVAFDIELDLEEAYDIVSDIIDKYYDADDIQKHYKEASRKIKREFGDLDDFVDEVVDEYDYAEYDLGQEWSDIEEEEMTDFKISKIGKVRESEEDLEGLYEVEVTGSFKWYGEDIQKGSITVYLIKINGKYSIVEYD